MRLLRFVLAIVAAVFLLVPIAAQTLDADLQRAIQREMTTGDPKAAIAEYQRIVSRAGTNRPVAAQALLRMADCYRKLGDAQARKIYEQIVKDYSDQAIVVASARQQLGLRDSVKPPDAGAGSRVVCSDCVAEFTGPSVSPDGRSILFTSDDGNLIARDLGNGEERAYTTRPTNTTGNAARFPVLSPDARQIAYYATGKDGPFGQLRLMPNQPGARHRVLVENAEFRQIIPTAWAPDGKRLLVEIERPDRTWAIAWVSADDGAITVLKSLDWRHRYSAADRPMLSPDGKFIAFSARLANPRTFQAMPDPPGMRVYVLSSDGTSESAIIETAGHYGYPVWTPDGTHVVFLSDRGLDDRNHLNVWAVPIRNGKAAGVPSLVARDVGDDDTDLFGFSPAGVLHYRTWPISVSQIVIPPAGSMGDWNKQPLTVLEGARPRWSPDGRSIAFLRRGRLIVRSLDTGDQRTVNQSSEPIGEFAWLRNGSGLLATAAGILRRFDLSSGERSDLISLKGRPLRYAGFVPSGDGRSAFFLNQDRTGAIVEVDVASGAVRHVLEPPKPGLYFDRVAVSPNGRSLAILLRSASVNPAFPTADASMTDSVRLATVNVDGTRYREIFGPFTQALFGSWLTWASDDHVLFATTTPDRHIRLMRTSVADGQTQGTGIEKPAAGSAVSQFDFSPAGSRLAFMNLSDEADSRLYALDLSSLMKK